MCLFFDQIAYICLCLWVSPEDTGRSDCQASQHTKPAAKVRHRSESCKSSKKKQRAAAEYKTIKNNRVAWKDHRS